MCRSRQRYEVGLCALAENETEPKPSLSSHATMIAAYIRQSKRIYRATLSSFSASSLSVSHTQRYRLFFTSPHREHNHRLKSEVKNNNKSGRHRHGADGFEIGHLGTNTLPGISHLDAVFRVSLAFAILRLTKTFRLHYAAPDTQLTQASAPHTHSSSAQSRAESGANPECSFQFWRGRYVRYIFASGGAPPLSVFKVHAIRVCASRFAVVCC